VALNCKRIAAGRFLLTLVGIRRKTAGKDQSICMVRLYGQALDVTAEIYGQGMA